MKKLRSDITKYGLARTPHRAFMRAMGLDDAAIEKQSISGTVDPGFPRECGSYRLRYRSGHSDLGSRGLLQAKIVLDAGARPAS